MAVKPGFNWNAGRDMLGGNSTSDATTSIGDISGGQLSFGKSSSLETLAAAALIAAVVAFVIFRR